VTTVAQYDVVVVGAGISGLLSALALSKEGKSVLVLEKEKYIGGLCRSYNHQGYTVDTGPHIITRLDSGPLKVLMDKYFDLVPYFVPFGNYHLRINGQLKQFPWSIKEWMMFDLLPLEDRALLMKAVFEVAYLISTGADMTQISIQKIMPKNLSTISVAFLDYLSYFMLGTGPENAPVSRFIDRKNYKTENSREENLLSIPYMGRLYNMLIGGKPTDQYYPRGGIQKIVDSMAQSLPKNVDVHLDEALLKVNTSGIRRLNESIRKVTGVTSSNTEYAADAVVYSGFATDIPSLLHDELPKNYVENLSTIEKVNSLTIWLGLDEPIFKDKGSEMWVSTSQDTLHTWMIPTSNYDPLLAPKDKHLVGFAFIVPTDMSLEEAKEKAKHTIFNAVPALEKHLQMIHYQELVPEKAIWSINTGFGHVETPIENMFCVGSDSFKRSMGLTRASYSVLNMLEKIGIYGNQI
jgi:phytoene dehydrogenase-like protein